MLTCTAASEYSKIGFPFGASLATRAAHKSRWHAGANVDHWAVKTVARQVADACAAGVGPALEWLCWGSLPPCSMTNVQRSNLHRQRCSLSRPLSWPTSNPSMSIAVVPWQICTKACTTWSAGRCLAIPTSAPCRDASTLADSEPDAAAASTTLRNSTTCGTRCWPAYPHSSCTASLATSGICVTLPTNHCTAETNCARKLCSKCGPHVRNNTAAVAA
mmetsp:Transcript_73803/g.191673  ORF Transcript_73803/g.191673 Transcript_73803/m.191673 type:complete len:218 (+) Transcript_73803:486-1139(+)